MDSAGKTSVVQPGRRQTLYWAVAAAATLILGIWVVASLGADGSARLLEAVAKLLGALTWPAVIIFLFVRYGGSAERFIASKSFGDFMNSIREGEVKSSVLGFSFKREELTTKLTAAIAAGDLPRDPQGRPTEASLATANAAAQYAQEALQLVGSIDPSTIRQAEGAAILWVDDRPANNDHERAAFEASGLRVDISISTDDAMMRLKTRKYSAIISDMGRPPDARAGYTLLEMLRSSGDRTPYIIYAGSRSAEHQAEARSRGALGCTNRPSELFQMVLSAIAD